MSGPEGAFISMFIRWLDRVLAEPVMRERINRGSDQFFEAEEKKKWREFEIEDEERVKFRIPRSPRPPSDPR